MYLNIERLLPSLISDLVRERERERDTAILQKLLLSSLHGTVHKNRVTHCNWLLLPRVVLRASAVCRPYIMCRTPDVAHCTLHSA